MYYTALGSTISPFSSGVVLFVLVDFIFSMCSKVYVLMDKGKEKVWENFQKGAGLEGACRVPSFTTSPHPQGPRKSLAVGGWVLAAVRKLLGQEM